MTTVWPQYSSCGGARRPARRVGAQRMVQRVVELLEVDLRRQIHLVAMTVDHLIDKRPVNLLRQISLGLKLRVIAEADEDLRAESVKNK